MAPCALLVDRTVNNDNFIVMLSGRKMKELKLAHNAIVQITGIEMKTTVCAVHKSDHEDHKVLMNRVIRYNLGVYLNDAVMIQPCKNISVGTRIYVELVDSESSKVTA